MIKISDILKISLHRFCGVFLQFCRNRSGVAALEFALIAPIMILLYVGALELSLAVSVDRKMSRLASIVGDLVTQVDDMDNSAIQDIMEVSKDVMSPYRGNVKIRVSGIEIQPNGNGKVVWSCWKNWKKLSKNSFVTVPKKIRKNGDFLVFTQVKTEYHPIIGWVGYDRLGVNFDKTAINMSDEIFSRPRLNPIVSATCS